MEGGLCADQKFRSREGRGETGAEVRESRGEGAGGTEAEGEGGEKRDRKRDRKK